MAKIAEGLSRLLKSLPSKLIRKQICLATIKQSISLALQTFPCRMFKSRINNFLCPLIRIVRSRRKIQVHNKIKYKEGIVILSYLFLLLPNVILNGIFNSSFLIGDPFYTARMKPGNAFTNYSETLYAKNDSLLNGKTEIISLGELLISKISLILRLEITELYIYSSIFFGLIVLLLFQLILKEFNIMGYKSLVLSICMIFVSWGPFFPYSLERPVSPQIILSLWLLILLICFRSIKNPSTINRLIAGTITGLSIYFHYPYIFLQTQAGLILFLLSMVIRKQPFKSYMSSILVSWIVAMPYFLWSWRANQFSEYRELLLRAGLIETHLPHAVRTLVISLVSLTILRLILKRSKQSLDKNVRTMIILLGSFALGNVFVSNSNLVTGKALQFADHFEVFVKAILILCISILFKYLTVSKPLEHSSIKRLNKNLHYMISTLIFALSFTFAANTNTNVGISVYELEIVDWLRKNIPNNTTISIEAMSIANISSPLLPHKILTNNDIINYSFHQQEINQRYFANSGCNISSIDDTTYSAIYTFRGTSGISSGERVLQLLKTTNSFPGLQNSIENFLASQRLVIDDLKTEALSDFLKVKEMGCLNFIRSRGVEYILINSEKNWMKYIKSGEIEFFGYTGELAVYSVT